MNRRALLALVLAVPLAGAGCATIDSEALRVSLASVSVAEAALLEQKYLLRVRLQNPSDRALKLDGFVYDLSLNGRAFARGVSDQQVVVPRFGEAVIDLPAVGSTGAVIRQVIELGGGRRQVDYRLTGRANEGGVRLRFDGLGDVPIPKQLFDLAK
jgi:LEA14-like dessication related protein